MSVPIMTGYAQLSHAYMELSPGIDFETKIDLLRSLAADQLMHVFARGEWGGEWHPDLAPKDGDVVIAEHWAHSGFANADLDLQLKQHDSRA